MLQAGKNITSPRDNLQKIDIAYFHNAIRHPKPKLKEFVQQLRKLRTIDEKQYNRQKRNLPYIVTGIFKPPFRKTDNFAVVHHFIIDLDHLTEHDFDINQLKAELSNDKQIALMFASPGYDGLKIVFNLKNPCYDYGKYSQFYKSFARQFAISKKLESVIDMNTSDVTRACFFSYDPDAWYNEKAMAVDMEKYTDFNNPYEIKQIEKENKAFIKNQPRKDNKVDDKQHIEDEVLTNIKKTLKPDYKTKAEKQIFVPEETEEIIEEFRKTLEDHKLILEEVTSINYGKKLRISIGRKWAEINVFYGKKGFSLVKTPKRGSDKALTDIAHQILATQLFG